MTQQIALPQSLLEKLAAARTPEEVKAVLTAQSDLQEYMSDQTSVGSGETPNQAYSRLRREFALELEGVAIARQDAAEEYGLNSAAITRWEEKGLVRVIEKAKRRGLPSKISKRDVAIMSEMHRLFRSEGNKSGPIKGFKPPAKLN